MSAKAPHSKPSSPANGSAEWPPDDRLRRVIQYSKTPVIEPRRRGVLDTPHALGMTILSASGSLREARWLAMAASIEPMPDG
jgi:hypothetical protein